MSCRMHTGPQDLAVDAPIQRLLFINRHVQLLPLCVYPGQPCPGVIVLRGVLVSVNGKHIVLQ